MPAKSNRRQFLQQSARTAAGVAAAVAAGPTVRTARGQTVSKNEQIGIGLVGCGGRGTYLMGIFQSLPEVRFTAVCDVNKLRAAEAAKKAGNGATAYGDFRELLRDKSVDAVIVATTGQWHVLPAIEACAAEKDVYLEKPVGTSIGEGRAMITAARKSKRIVQMGTQQRSWEHYHKAVEIIRSGALGNISNVHVFDLENFYPGFGAPPDAAPPPELDWDFFVGPSPEVKYNPNRYSHHYWFYDYGGGWQLDWAVHHYDIVHWAMGVTAPIAAVGLGGKYAFPKDNTQWPDTFNGACEYPPGPVAKDGFLMTYTFRGGCWHPIERRTHGKAFYGTDAALFLDRSGYEVVAQYRDGKKVVEDQKAGAQPEHDVLRTHAKGFLTCIASRKDPFANIEVGHAASNPGHLMNIALRAGCRVRWDAEKERVIDNPQADALVHKKYRKPWQLPT